MKHSKGPWKAHLNVPTAVIPGHLIKTDDSIQLPIASLWEGGGTEGKPKQIANAHLIAAAPELLDSLIHTTYELCNLDCTTDEIEDAIKKAKQIINKATGATK